MYNMDEKGFLIGFLSKAKRIFTKDWFESNNLIGNIQYGSREWITLVATLCANGSSLPPALVYMAKSGDIQDAWVQDLDHTVHQAYFASSPSGWADNYNVNRGEVGYAGKSNTRAYNSSCLSFIVYWLRTCHPVWRSDRLPRGSDFTTVHVVARWLQALQDPLMAWRRNQSLEPLLHAQLSIINRNHDRDG